MTAIARPYAQAAYEFAKAKQEVPLWESMLRTAASAVREPHIARLISNTRISSEQWFSLLSDILKPYLNDDRKNFIHLLTENKRLSCMPDIAELFKEYEALDNKIAEVQVTSAVPLDDKQKQKLADKLSQYFKHPVTLRCILDKNILGGFIIHAGDKVIDSSVRGQLTRLLEFVIR